MVCYVLYQKFMYNYTLWQVTLYFYKSGYRGDTKYIFQVLSWTFVLNKLMQLSYEMKNCHLFLDIFPQKYKFTVH